MVYIDHQFCDRNVVFSDGVMKGYGIHRKLAGRENRIYAGIFAVQAQYCV